MRFLSSPQYKGGEGNLISGACNIGKISVDSIAASLDDQQKPLSAVFIECEFIIYSKIRGSFRASESATDTVEFLSVSGNLEEIGRDLSSLKTHSCNGGVDE